MGEEEAEAGFDVTQDASLAEEGGGDSEDDALGLFGLLPADLLEKSILPLMETRDLRRGLGVCSRKMRLRVCRYMELDAESRGVKLHCPRRRGTKEELKRAFLGELSLVVHLVVPKYFFYQHEELLESFLEMLAENRTLRVLTINRAIPVKRIVSLAKASNTSLTTLRMNVSGLTGETFRGLRGWFDALNCKSLKTLDLFYNRLGNYGLSHLASCNLSSLTDLNLSSNTIGVEGAKALARSDLHQLRMLNLSGNPLGPEGAQELASGNLSALRSLSLQGCNLFDEGVKFLTQGKLRNLTSLGLENNGLSEAAVTFLGRNGLLPELVELHLDNNPITDNGVDVLTQGGLAPLLHILSLRGAWLTSAGGTTLANGPFDCLVDLNLAWNDLGDVGAVALASSSRAKTVKVLDLSRNNISTTGAKALGDSREWTCLESLRLSCNHIDDPGAISLAVSSHLPSLRELNLEGNMITFVGLEVLSECPPVDIASFWSQEAPAMV